MLKCCLPRGPPSDMACAVGVELFNYWRSEYALWLLENFKSFTHHFDRNAGSPPSMCNVEIIDNDVICEYSLACQLAKWSWRAITLMWGSQGVGLLTGC